MTEENQEEFTLHGRKAMILAIFVSEVMVIGPMIALLPHWMAFWEPRFVGLLMMTMAAPFVMVLPATLRARVAEAVADVERARSTSIAVVTGHPEFIPSRSVSEAIEGKRES